MKTNQHEVTCSGAVSPLRELLLGTAFEPHPMDAEVPLCRRFAGKSLLLLMTSRERAATVRVRLDAGGVPTLSGTRQLGPRNKAEWVAVLRAEAGACGAEWVVVVMSSGWQAQYANRSTRSGDTEMAGAGPGRQALLRNDPGLFLGKPSAEHLYAAVDHPRLDRSVVFSVKRREIDMLAEDLREAGLGLAAVRVGVASMLEAWFSRAGEEACGRDLLVSDGLGVVLVAMERGDFVVAGESGIEGPGAPRQYANRPGDIVQDMERLCRENGTRPLRRVLAPGLAGGLQEPAVPSDLQELDPVAAVLDPASRHELHPLLEPRRPALGNDFRRRFRLGIAAAVLALLTGGLASGLTWSRQAEAERAQQASLLLSQREQGYRNQTLGLRNRRTEAMGQLAWLGTHVDAQGLTLRLLRDFPSSVALERLGVQLDESGRQLSLEFVMQGGEEAQTEALRNLERVLLGLEYRIGERSTPTASARGVLHRWRVLMPSLVREVQS